MKIYEYFINKIYGDSNAVTAENLFYDETRTISDEIKSTNSDNLTIEVKNAIVISGAGTVTCNGIYDYAGILSGKPYYTFGNYRIVWSTPNFRWELQQITPNTVIYYNDTSDDLSKPYYDSNWTTDTGVNPVPSMVSSDRIIKLKNISLIIDDGGLSIDGTNTPMVDSHVELVTRAYVDGTDAATRTFANGLWNDAGVVKLGSTPLTAGITTLAGTNQDFNIMLDGSGTNNINLRWANGSTNTGISINTSFIQMYKGSGASYANIMLHQTTGISITNNINSEGIKYAADYSAGFIARSLVDMEWVENQINNAGTNKQIDTFILTGIDITNGYLDLSQTIDNNEHNSVSYNGAILFEDASEDYTVDTVNNRINFTASQTALLLIGQKIQVKYKY